VGGRVGGGGPSIYWALPPAWWKRVAETGVPHTRGGGALVVLFCLGRILPAAAASLPRPTERPAAFASLTGCCRAGGGRGPCKIPKCDFCLNTKQRFRNASFSGLQQSSRGGRLTCFLSVDGCVSVTLLSSALAVGVCCGIFGLRLITLPCVLPCNDRDSDGVPCHGECVCFCKILTSGI